MQIVKEFPKVHYRVHNPSAVAPYPELKKSILHLHKYFSLLLLIMYSNLTKSLPLRSINEDFYAFFSSPMPSKCPIHSLFIYPNLHIIKLSLILTLHNSSQQAQSLLSLLYLHQSLCGKGFKSCRYLNFRVHTFTS
jgi:hypothetical protein